MHGVASINIRHTRYGYNYYYNICCRTAHTSKQQPCPLGTRPVPWAHVCFCFVFFVVSCASLLSFLFLFFSFFSVFCFLFCFVLPSSYDMITCIFLFFRCTHTVDGISLVCFGCKWYGVIYHSSLVPFPCSFLFLVFPARRFFVYSLFCLPRG